MPGSWTAPRGRFSRTGERQYVIDEGERVYGLFIQPEEDRCYAPIILEEAPERKRPGHRQPN